MAIHIDVLLDLQERRLKREADRLGKDLKADFTKIGTTSGTLLGDSLGEAAGRALSPRLTQLNKKVADSMSLARVREIDLNTERNRSDQMAKRLAKSEETLARKVRDGSISTDAAEKTADRLRGQRIALENVTRKSAKAEEAHATALSQAAQAQRDLSAETVKARRGKAFWCCRCCWWWCSPQLRDGWRGTRPLGRCRGCRYRRWRDRTIARCRYGSRCRIRCS